MSGALVSAALVVALVVTVAVLSCRERSDWDCHQADNGASWCVRR